jgi:hypothetical protein
MAQEVQPVYDLASKRRDLWMKGELALWLWRAGAFAQPPTDIAEPYALEISGDWRGAARAWQALGCPYEQANALASGGEPEQLEALTIMERLGATAAANALRKRMREQGMRRIPRGSRTSTRTNTHGLTKREAEIFELLAQGLRNSVIAKRLFVTTPHRRHRIVHRSPLSAHRSPGPREPRAAAVCPDAVPRRRAPSPRSDRIAGSADLPRLRSHRGR